MERTLVRNGWVIDTEPEPVVRPHTDVLVEGDRIVAVGADLPADDATVIDATDRIVLPGLVDTHRHTWQAALRGVAVDTDLMSYLDLVGGRLASLFTAEDVRVSTLAGALECLDAGITTLQDFSHIQRRPEHADAAVAGLTDAGIRAVFGYGYSVVAADQRRPDEVRRVRDQYFGTADQLVTMALGPLGPSYRPVEEAIQEWELARELDLRVFVHVGAGPVAQRPVQALRDHGVLTAQTTYVHANSLPDDELKLIADSGGAVSITPAVEARMGHGAPTVGRLAALKVTTGLGVDVVTSVAGDLFSVMRATLLTGQFSDGVRVGPADVLRMATIEGAAALGMRDRIGSLTPGKQADLVLLRADAINLAGAVHHDPIGAVVTAAHPGNVETVLVAGKVVKRGGQLVHPGLRTVIDTLGSRAERLAVAARGR
jgi:5-methylthioadenosine/S-adenosylhomocysteine deaminase